MMDFIVEVFDFMRAIGPIGWVLLALPLFLFELPRYTLLYIAAAIFTKPRKTGIDFCPEYSLIIVGHNEGAAIRNCVIALHEQSCPPAEILVLSDGSTDDTRRKLDELQDAGLIDAAHHVELRGGKSAALNLISQFATKDFVVQIDCDTSFERHAARSILQPFIDPKVGIVSGNIVPRNDDENLVTSFQAIEYLVSLALGRQASDVLGQVAIASGAFAAFRKSALEDCGGFDSGSGEDLDMTLKMRQRGWLARFVPEAIAFTNVPTSLQKLTKQRLRWERDAVSIRYHKYYTNFSPLDRRFDPIEAVNQIEFLLFNILAAAITPFYFLFVWFWFGEAVWVVMAGSYTLLILHDLIIFLIAIYMNPKIDFFKHILVLPLYSIYCIIYMRSLRLYAYFDEFTFHTSRKTDFVPQKVLNYMRDRS